MMPPVASSLISSSASDVDMVDVGSEAEGDDGDLIDVVGINTAGLSALSPDYPVGQGKKYHCQRCLNHGLEIPRKGHKRECQYADCQCEDCKLVEKRKILNREINNERDRVSNSPVTEIPDNEIDDSNQIVSKVRNPRCARCRAHDPDKEPPPLKGHKKACRYKNCECKKCSLITCRRDVMAKQIRLRRKQKSKSVPGDSESPASNQSAVVKSHHSSTDQRVQSTPIGQRGQTHKTCIDLVTPPAINETIECDPGESNRNSPKRPDPPGPQLTCPPSVLECHPGNPPVALPIGTNPGHVHFQFVTDTRPYQDLVCPQSLFAGFLHYMQAVAATSGHHGLTLPTTPASLITQSHHHPPSMAPPACPIPYCLGAHPRCMVNDHHRHPWFTNPQFGQGQPLMQPRLFTFD